MTLPPNNQTPPLGDDGFGRHYQAGSQELPGAAADAAVLALAREATAESRLRASVKMGGSDPVARGWSRRWQAPLALAACLVLAVGVVTRMQTQLPDATEVADRVATSASNPPVLSAPKSVAEAAPAAAPAAAPPRTSTPARHQQSAVSAQTHSETPAIERSPAVAETAKAKMADVTDAAGAASVGNFGTPGNPAVPPAAASTIMRDAAGANEPRAMSRMSARKPDSVDAGINEAQESTLTPQAWLARIVELRSNGRLAEADASLKRFRDLYPAFKVPPAASGQSE